MSGEIPASEPWGSSAIPEASGRRTLILDRVNFANILKRAAPLADIFVDAAVKRKEESLDLEDR